MAKPIRALELHYPMIQILIIMFRSRSFCATPRKGIQDSLGFSTPRRGLRYWIPVFVSGTWIIRVPIVRGIPDFLRDNPDSTSKILPQSG